MIKNGQLARHQLGYSKMIRNELNDINAPSWLYNSYQVDYPLGDETSY